MISSLQQIVLNYERTNEGKKAKEILDFLVPSKKKEEKTTDTENKEIENKEQASEPEITENETDIIPTNESETSARIEEIPQEKPKETPKEEQKNQKPTKLERPVQSWEKQYLD